MKKLQIKIDAENNDSKSFSIYYDYSVKTIRELEAISRLDIIQDPEYSIHYGSKKFILPSTTEQKITDEKRFKKGLAELKKIYSSVVKIRKELKIIDDKMEDLSN